MPDMRYDAVLLYHPRDRATVEQIARWLEDRAQMTVWFDLWQQVPGSDRRVTIGEALEQARSCVIFMGAQGLENVLDPKLTSVLKQRVEARRLRVVPALLPGGRRLVKESHLPTFLRHRAWVEFPENWREMDPLHITAPPPRPETAPVAQTDVCPFRGLEAFREEDRRFFFGREALVQRLIAHLREHRFLALLGPSGCGKSSVIQAGLLPPLRKQGILIAQMSPRKHPLEELAIALRRLVARHGEALESERLVERLSGNRHGFYFMAREILDRCQTERLVVVIDQFEEIFTQTNSERERHRFLGSLFYAVERGGVAIVLTMRSDFLGKCAYHSSLNTFINDHLVHMETLEGDSLRQALVEPASLVGLHFEEGLISRIMAEVGGAPGEMPLVGHALLELFKRRRDNLLTLGAFEEIGGIEGALARRAEWEFAKMDDVQRAMLRKMFVLALVQPGEGTEDTRRRAAKEELLTIGASPQQAEFLLRQWTDARLLTTDHDPVRGVDWVDVAHEALIRKWPRIQAWMAEDRESARQIGKLRAAAAEWRRNQAHPDYLFQGAQLLQVEHLHRQQPEGLTLTERDFLGASIAKGRRVQWLRRGVVALLGTMAMVAAVAAVVANQQRIRAETEARTSEAVVGFLVGLFKKADPTGKSLIEIIDPGKSPAETMTAREILDEGSRKIEKELENVPAVQAKLMHTMGEVYSVLGLYPEAIRFFENALAIKRDRLGNGHPSLGDTLYHFAIALRENGAYDQSEQHFLQALTLQRHHEPHAATLANTLDELGVLYHQHLGKLEEADALYRRALAMRREILGDRHPDMAISYNNLAGIHWAKGELDKSEEFMLKAVQLGRDLYGKEHLQVAQFLNNLAGLYMFQGKDGQAEPLFREALAIRRAILGPEHGLVANSLTNLGVQLLNMDQFEEADGLLWEALAINRQRLPEDHRNILSNLRYLALLRHETGEYGDAERIYNELLKIQIKHKGSEDPGSIQTRLALTEVLLAKGDSVGAESLCREIMKICASVPDQDQNLAKGRVLMGAALAEQGRFNESEGFLLEGYRALTVDGSRTTFTDRAAEYLVSLYEAMGVPEKAEPYRKIPP